MTQRRILYQDVFEPSLKFPGTVTPSQLGFVGEHTPRFVKPFPVTEQQFCTVFGTAPVVPDPPGIYADQIHTIRSRRLVIYQGVASPLAPITQAAVTPTQLGFIGEQTPRFAKPFPVTEQQFWDIGTLTFPGTATPVQLGFVGEQTPKFAKPFPVTEQQFFDLGRWSFPGTATPTQLGFIGDQTPRFAKPFPIGDQQASAGRVEPPPPAPNGWSVVNPELFAKPFPANEQQFFDIGTLTFPGTVTPGQLGWVGEQTPRFAKPFPAIEQQFFDLGRWSFPGTSTPTQLGFVGDQTPLFAKPFNASLQQFWTGEIDQPSTGTPTPTQLGFIGDQTPRFAKPFPASEQQFFDIGTLRFPGTPTTGPLGWAGYFPEAFAKPFPAKLQQFWDIGTLTFPGTANPLQLGWHFQQPELFGKPFPAKEQQDFAIGTLTFPGTPTPAQFGWLFQQPELFGKPFIERDFAVLGIQPPPFPNGWAGDFGWKFSTPINASLQQFWAGRVDQPSPAAQNPFILGFIGNQEYRFAKPYPVTLQQFWDIGTLTFPGVPTPSPVGWFGYEPEAFAKPFPPFLQRFDQFQPLGNITSVPSAPTAPDPWYPDEKTPYYPDREQYKKLLERLKRNERVRWKQLTGTDKHRVKLRAAIETVIYGVEDTAPEDVVVKLKAEKAVKAVRELGVKVETRKDYDFVVSSIREYERKLEFDRFDEEDVELLLISI